MAVSQGPESKRLYQDISSLESYSIGPLVIELGGHSCPLDWVDKSKPEDLNHVYIAYYDPRLEPHRTGGAIELTNRLVYLAQQTDSDLVIITPSSDKSTGLVEVVQSKTVDKLGRNVYKMIFRKGEPESEEMKSLADQSSSISHLYQPITAGGEYRRMVITEEEINVLKEHIRKGDMLVVVDDVYSTGSTIGAIMDILKEVYQRCGSADQFEMPPILTVMRECDLLADGTLDITEIPYKLMTAAI